jgi:hypothetical protein
LTASKNHEDDEQFDSEVDEDPCLKHFDRNDWVPDFTKGNYDVSAMSKIQKKLFDKLRRNQIKRKNYGWFGADLKLLTQ